MKVVVCGGGIIGNCTAYYLLKHNIKCTVVEQGTVACAASGKAGGFLARDWCKSDGALHEFAKFSFDLHCELAKEFDGKQKYDYRRLEAFSAEINRLPKKQTTEAQNNKVPWVNGTHIEQRSIQCIGKAGNVAQLHPFKFVNTLCEYSKSKGAQFIEQDSVCDLLSENQNLIGVKLTSGLTIDCDAIILCMGPWTGLASKWIPNFPSIHGQKAHSITVAPKIPIPAQAVFTDYGQYSPELYPRPDGEVYVCGMAENPVSSAQLPLPQDIHPTSNSCQKIKDMTDLVGDALKEGQVTKSQACYLPLTQDGLPLIGKLKELNGVFVGAGHGCWGILNAPATGKALAELVACGHSTINIDAFDPNRFT
uniref:Putative oxidoreductase TDA3 n=1 Tax=Phallusia mammillata TaxID=59560 RepID=A0A6F9DNZ8_9ASCI|nr:putative oxidoreductase TDA3 [Phallusia mammillata]